MKRFDVILVNLDPTIGSEIQKTIPCVIVSPNELNSKLNTLIVAPLTTKSFLLPTRHEANPNKQKGLILCDQIRTIDKKRVIKKLDTLSNGDSLKLCEILCEMFGD